MFKLDKGVLVNDDFIYNGNSIYHNRNAIIDAINDDFIKAAKNRTSTRCTTPVHSREGIFFISLPLKMVDGKIINQL